MNLTKPVERQIKKNRDLKLKVELYKQYRELRRLEREIIFWMIDIMQGNISFSEIEADLKNKLKIESLQRLYLSAYENKKKKRVRADLADPSLSFFGVRQLAEHFL